MQGDNSKQSPPRVLIFADVESNAKALSDRVLTPAGIVVISNPDPSIPVDVLIVDVTQLRGDPLAKLRLRRANGDEAPAIVLAAHFPPSRLRDLFRLGVGDVLLKPYRPVELCRAIYELSEARAAEVSSQILARRLQAIRQRLNQSSEEIRLLSEIGRAVASLDNVDQILTRVVEAAAYLTEAEEANLYLAEPHSDEVILRASKHIGERHGTLQSLRVTDTLAGHVYSTGQPVLRQPMFSGEAVKVQTGFLVQSLIKVPIKVQQETVGVLGVYNRLSPRSFSEHHVTLLLALSNWAGVSLERSSLMQRSEQAAPAKRGLSIATQTFRRGLDRSITDLERYLRGEVSPVPATREAHLKQVCANLESLRELRIAVLSGKARSGLIDLGGIVQETANALRPQASTWGLELSAEADPDVPLFPGDPKRARRVIEALAAIALRQTRKGEICLKARRLEINRRPNSSEHDTQPLELRNGEWAAATIVNTGRTMPGEILQALLTPTAEANAGHIGPGLSMGEVRMIAESMGGVLYHEQLEERTAFTFALPIA